MKIRTIKCYYVLKYYSILALNTNIFRKYVKIIVRYKKCQKCILKLRRQCFSIIVAGFLNTI